MYKYIIVAVIAYLLGNIQTSYLLGKYIKKTDIRDYGSGNAGTTNALRVFGKKLAILTLLIDAFKGVIAVFIGRAVVGEDGGLISAVLVVVGHNYPFYLKFKGGKGIATTIGAGITLTPFAGIISICLGLIIILKSKYVSLGGLIGMFLWPLVYIVVQSPINIKMIIVMVILIIMVTIKHRENIIRLLNKKENKLSFKKKN